MHKLWTWLSRESGFSIGQSEWALHTTLMPTHASLLLQHTHHFMYSSFDFLWWKSNFAVTSSSHSAIVVVCGTQLTNPPKEGGMSPPDMLLWQHLSRCLLWEQQSFPPHWFQCIRRMFPLSLSIVQVSFPPLTISLHFREVGSGRKHILWAESGDHPLELCLPSWRAQVCDERVYNVLWSACSVEHGRSSYEAVQSTTLLKRSIIIICLVIMRP